MLRQRRVESRRKSHSDEDEWRRTEGKFKSGTKHEIENHQKSRPFTAHSVSAGHFLIHETVLEFYRWEEFQPTYACGCHGHKCTNKQKKKHNVPNVPSCGEKNICAAPCWRTETVQTAVYQKKNPKHFAFMLDFKHVMAEFVTKKTRKRGKSFPKCESNESDGVGWLWFLLCDLTTMRTSTLYHIEVWSRAMLRVCGWHQRLGLCFRLGQNTVLHR